MVLAFNDFAQSKNALASALSKLELTMSLPICLASSQERSSITIRICLYGRDGAYARSARIAASLPGSGFFIGIVLGVGFITGFGMAFVIEFIVIPYVGFSEVVSDEWKH